MLKTRIIMTLLIRNYQLVKGLKFDKSRFIDTILPTIKIYSRREVDELVIYDTEAMQLNRIDYDLIKEIGQNINIPLAYGGGITSLDQIRKILRSGADKVVLNTSLYSNKNLLIDACEEFGSQCIVVGIDVKSFQGEYYCHSNSGETNTYVKLENWLSEILPLNPGELILTSIDHDGMMQGFDIELYNSLKNFPNVPIIASGGAGKLEDFRHVLECKNVNSVAAASIFHFTEITPKLIRAKLKENGFNVRK